MPILHLAVQSFSATRSLSENLLVNFHLNLSVVSQQTGSGVRLKLLCKCKTADKQQEQPSRRSNLVTFTLHCLHWVHTQMLLNKLLVCLWTFVLFKLFVAIRCMVFCTCCFNLCLSLYELLFCFFLVNKLGHYLVPALRALYGQSSQSHCQHMKHTILLIPSKHIW